MSNPLVSIVMGSNSDAEVMEEAARVLRDLKVPFEIGIYSAHRTPERSAQFAAEASARGVKVIVAGAGAAAHLAGALAARTQLPVIGVPLASTPLQGFDALLATVQMPSGFPVATMAVGKAGAANAAFLAAQILALEDEELRGRLGALRARKANAVEAASEAISSKGSSPTS
jgi:phosphoribosylaminoimidazole carboxylase PurE protein